LTWKEARIIVDHYFNFWPDGEDRLWAKNIWQFLENIGLTIFRTDIEEIEVRSRVAILALVYQEFCARLGYLDIVGADCKPLQEVHYAEIFQDSIEQIDQQIFKVVQALVDNHGERALFQKMYESILRGSHASLTEEQAQAEIVESIARIDDYGTAESRAFQFLASGGCSIENFENCSITESGKY